MKINKQQLKAIMTFGCFLILTPSVNATSQAEDLPSIQKQWAKCQYDTFNNDNKKQCLEDLVKQTQQSLNQSPNQSDLKVWLAITKSTLAGVDGGLSALSLAKESKVLLDEVIKKDPEVLDGSAFTSLGSLYYKVPGWPIGFGDNDKAEEMLKKALTINPTGIDPNYFYGDFLAQDGRQSEAIVYLKKAQQAAPRSLRPLADKGRQQEIANKLKELQ